MANHDDCKTETTPPQQERQILAVVPDLFFGSKISGAAKRIGVSIEFVREKEKLLQQTSAAPSLVILDLHHPDALGLIVELKQTVPARDVFVIGFFSHVQQDLQRDATKAGCDLVLPRSVFSQNVDELLRQRSCHL